METVNPPKTSGGLVTRVISALVMIPPVVAAIYFGSIYFDALIYIAVLVLAWEWSNLCQRNFKWMVFGAIYIAVPSMALLHIRGGGEWGLSTMLWLFGVVWAMDIGAYAFGKTLGGPKLIPSVSPNKTWAGFIGGSLCSGVVGLVTVMVTGHGNYITMILLGVIIGMISQAGDLIESALKRHFNVKDSGNLIPGHGGLLDRADGLLTASVAVVVADYLIEGELLLW